MYGQYNRGISLGQIELNAIIQDLEKKDIGIEDRAGELEKQADTMKNKAKWIQKNVTDFRTEITDLKLKVNQTPASVSKSLDTWNVTSMQGSASQWPLATSTHAASSDYFYSSSKPEKKVYDDLDLYGVDQLFSESGDTKRQDKVYTDLDTSTGISKPASDTTKPLLPLFSSFSTFDDPDDSLLITGEVGRSLEPGFPAISGADASMIKNQSEWMQEDVASLRTKITNMESKVNKTPVSVSKSLDAWNVTSTQGSASQWSLATSTHTASSDDFSSSSQPEKKVYDGLELNYIDTFLEKRCSESGDTKRQDKVYTDLDISAGISRPASDTTKSLQPLLDSFCTFDDSDESLPSITSDDLNLIAQEQQRLERGYSDISHDDTSRIKNQSECMQGGVAYLRTAITNMESKVNKTPASVSTSLDEWNVTSTQGSASQWSLATSTHAASSDDFSSSSQPEKKVCEGSELKAVNQLVSEWIGLEQHFSESGDTKRQDKVFTDLDASSGILRQASDSTKPLQPLLDKFCTFDDPNDSLPSITQEQQPLEPVYSDISDDDTSMIHQELMTSVAVTAAAGVTINDNSPDESYVTTKQLLPKLSTFGEDDEKLIKKERAFVVKGRKQKSRRQSKFCQFLFKQLEDKNKSNIIQWMNKDFGVFQVKNKEELSNAWGNLNNKTNKWESIRRLIGYWCVPYKGGFSKKCAYQFEFNEKQAKLYFKHHNP